MAPSKTEDRPLVSKERKSFAQLLAEDPALAQKITHCPPGVAWGAMETVCCTVRVGTLRGGLTQ